MYLQSEGNFIIRWKEGEEVAFSNLAKCLLLAIKRLNFLF